MSSSLFERALWKSARIACPVMQVLDNRLLKWKAGQPASPPIFIIGAPRAGTTLLYQVLTQRYDLAHFTNLTAPFYRTPLVAFWIESWLFPKPKINHYTSQFGKTDDWHGPHECGDFWYRWFPRGEQVYVPPGTVSPRTLRAMRHTVHAMSAVSGTAVVFKNVYNSMRIAPLMEAFPQGSFLVCCRDPVDIAQSILNSRIQALGCKDAWWSLPPKEILDIQKHPYWQQVVEQAYYIYRQIAQDRHRFGEGRFFDVDYEALCQDSIKTLAGIERFLGECGIHLQVERAVPQHFAVSTGRQVDDEDYRRISEAVAQLWGD